MKEHLWKNPRERGRPISGLEPAAELPWIEGVALSTVLTFSGR
jgi:hypothetical protein